MLDSTEWLHTDSRRTAIGLDLDLEALNWCMENNLNKIGADGYSRIYLFHGNVLTPLEAILVKFENQYLLGKVTLTDNEDDDGSETVGLDSTVQKTPGGFPNGRLMKDFPLPARDIICAFNYSCCCLHSRVELVSYFKHSRNALSRKGGIFVMDLYGGTSSECELRLQRKFPNFTVSSYFPRYYCVEARDLPVRTIIYQLIIGEETYFIVLVPLSTQVVSHSCW